MTRHLTTREVADLYGVSRWCVRDRAKSAGLGRMDERGRMMFSPAEARRIGGMRPLPGRKPTHGYYIGWRDPDKRKECLRKLRKAGRPC